jgi:ribose transport system substrate-binding protein
MKLRRRPAVLAAVGLAVGAMAPVSTGVTAGAASLHPGASTKAWVIGVSNGYFGNTARVEYEAELKAYAASPAVAPHIKRLIINNAGTSVAAQISAVDEMIAEHVNAIILDSNSTTGLNPAIAAAAKAGIVVVAANDIVTSNLAYHVETVGHAFGATMAKAFVALLHGRGNIVVLRGIAGNAVDAAEASGFNSVFAKYPGIHVLATVYPQWDDAQAQTDMASLLSRFNDINGVFTEGGMEQGVVRAYVAAHRKFVPVSGTDENGFACQLKQYHAQGLQGVQVGTAIYAYALALKTALGALSGHKEPRTIPIHWTVWATEQSIKQCSPRLSPGLFLQTEDPTDGILLTPAQVNSYLTAAH